MLLLLSPVLITVGTEVCIPKALLQSALIHCRSVPCSLIPRSVIPVFLLFPVIAQVVCCRDCSIVLHPRRRKNNIHENWKTRFSRSKWVWVRASCPMTRAAGKVRKWAWQGMSRGLIREHKTTGMVPGMLKASELYHQTLSGVFLCFLTFPWLEEVFPRQLVLRLTSSLW